MSAWTNSLKKDSSVTGQQSFSGSFLGDSACTLSSTRQLLLQAAVTVLWEWPFFNPISAALCEYFRNMGRFLCTTGFLGSWGPDAGAPSWPQKCYIQPRVGPKARSGLFDVLLISAL